MPQRAIPISRALCVLTPRTSPWRAADSMSVARSLAPLILCLPMFAELTDGEADRVATAIHEFYGAD